jgi:hypothetical protein
MTRRLLGLIFFAWIQTPLLAQQVEHEGEFWGSYISSVRVSDKWGIWNDFHYTTNSFFLSRHGLTYFFNPNITASGGYAYVTTATSFTNQLVRDEHRPWGQVVGNFPLTDKILYQLRFRYDARFRQGISGTEFLEERIFYNRLRAMAMIRFHVHNISDRTNIHFRVMNELLFNAGGQATNGVDQNRLYLLPAITHRNLTVLTGYHWRVIPHPGRNTVYKHGLTFWVLHTMDFRRN